MRSMWLHGVWRLRTLQKKIHKPLQQLQSSLPVLYLKKAFYCLNNRCFSKIKDDQRFVWVTQTFLSTVTSRKTKGKITWSIRITIYLQTRAMFFPAVQFPWFNDFCLGIHVPCSFLLSSLENRTLASLLCP